MDNPEREYNIKKDVIKKMIRILYKKNKLYDRQFFHKKTLEKALAVYGQVYHLVRSSVNDISFDCSEDGEEDPFAESDRMIKECIIETFKDVPNALFSSRSRAYIKDVQQEVESLNIAEIPDQLNKRLKEVMASLKSMKKHFSNKLNEVIDIRMEYE